MKMTWQPSKIKRKRKIGYRARKLGLTEDFRRKTGAGRRFRDRVDPVAVGVFLKIRLEDAARLGEFAFGLNPCVDLITTDILIDEKMGGTIHTALGRPYDNAYYSRIHWDIVKDARTEATVYIDDIPVFRDGRIL